MKFINYRPINTKVNYDDQDSIETLKQNLKKQPPNWPYRNKIISYKFNDQGFRHKDNISKIDWNQSIVFFGCSETFGCGLAEQDTVVKQVEKMLGIPTVNLGISGSAVDLAMINSTILSEHNYKPKAIVHIWTNPTRYTHFVFNNNELHSVRFLPKTPGYVASINWEERSKFYVSAERSLWKNSVTRYEMTFTNLSAEAFGVDLVEYVDKARDDRHPGIETNYNAALLISKNLKHLLNGE
jgi:hypothetical protein